MAQNQQGDIKLFQTPNNGDIDVVNGVVTMSGGLETMAYLCLFGGNSDDAAGDDTSFSWWGNTIEDRPERTIRSETQYLLGLLPAIPANLVKIEAAVKRDLQVFINQKIASEIQVNVSMPGTKKVQIDISIQAIGELEQFSFTENWQAESIQYLPLPASPVDYPLDLYPLAIFDFLFYKGSSQYSGDWGVVRRSSDGASMTVGFSADIEHRKQVYDWRSMRQWGNPNQAIRTEEFDDATWNKVNATITPNAGTVARGLPGEASLLLPVNNVDYHYISQTISKKGTTQIKTFSIAVKSLGGANVVLYLESNSGGAWATYDLTGGFVAQTDTWGSGFVFLGATIEKVDDSFIISISARTNLQANVIITPLIADTAENNYEQIFQGRADFGVYINGAQLEPGSELTDYTKNQATPGSEKITLERYFCQSDNASVSSVEQTNIAKQPVIWDDEFDAIRDKNGRLGARWGDTDDVLMESPITFPLTSQPLLMVGRFQSSVDGTSIRILLQAGPSRMAFHNQKDWRIRMPDNVIANNTLSLNPIVLSNIANTFNSEIFINSVLQETGDCGNDQFGGTAIMLGNEIGELRSLSGVVGDLLLYTVITIREQIEKII